MSLTARNCPSSSQGTRSADLLETRADQDGDRADPRARSSLTSSVSARPRAGRPIVRARSEANSTLSRTVRA